MKKLISLSQTDFYSTFRDPVFRGLLFFPFLSFAIIRWALPELVKEYPALIPFTEVILMWACLQSATMFGFIYGFLFLEEKEENIWQVIRILPVSGKTLVFSRLLVGLLISTLVNYCLIHFGRIVDFPFIKEIVLSLLFSLAAPLIATSLGALGKNRIEGMAQMKVVNILLIIPALIYFIPHSLTHISLLIPTYWSFRSMEMAESPYFVLFLFAGYVWHAVFILYFIRKLSNDLSQA